MNRHASKVRGDRARFFSFLCGKQGNRPLEKWRREALDFRPSLESLEARTLMAADMPGMDMSLPPPMNADSGALERMNAPRPQHNSLDAEDVNDDGSCTPADALVIINAINANRIDASNFSDVNGDGQCTAADVLQVVNRLNAGGNWHKPQPQPNPNPSPPPTAGEVRSIDGTGNNQTNTTWGSVGADLLRTAPAAYGDGISSPAGADRPSAREISNEVSDQGNESILNSRDLSAMAYAWGQFIDHDMDLTPTGGNDVLTIAVPQGDPSFDPTGTGTQAIYTGRSVFDAATGMSADNPRQQVNTITAFLDGSMIYGSDATTVAELRTMSGGQLKTSDGNLLPLNDPAVLGGPALGMANDAHVVSSDKLFAAGDVRANENIELTSLQTLFMREHNFWASKIAAANPSLTDEQVYQQARSIVIGEIQSITYNQWLPSLLGPGAVKPYGGYDATVNPGIANEFSTAAFRFGHSIVGNDVEFMDNNGDATQGEIPLAMAFFNPDVVKASDIDPLLKYLSSDVAQELDTKVVDSLRNFLFGPPGAGGLDLASLNIERGRDNGLADYNTVRAAYGLPKVTSFSQITSDSDLAAKLQSLYGSVDNIDLWVGGLAEDHVRGSSMGATFTTILADQFQRLRDGDRFWFERVFSGAQLNNIEHTTLADVIERNTGLTNLQDNVFFFKASAEGQVFVDANGNGVQDGRIERGIGGVTLQLLDEDGSVVGSTVTGRDGRYRVDGFSSAGDYQIQIMLPNGAKLTTDGLLDFHIATGGQGVRGLNFGLAPLKWAPTAAAGVDTDSDFTAAVDAIFTGS
jgi:peroxidase